MKTIFQISKTILLGSSTNFADSQNGDKRISFKKIFLYGILALAFIYFAALTVVMVKYVNDFLSPYNLQGLIVSLMLNSLSFLVFFFGLFYVLTVFYYSKDVDFLLALPVEPGKIILSKFFTSLLYEYILITLIFLPSMLAYGILNSAGFLYYLYMLLVMIFLPVLPLALSAILIMLVMRFSPFAKNKDRFSLVAGLLSLAMALGINFAMRFVGGRFNLDENFSLLLEDGVKAIGKISNRIFPNLYFANQALLSPQKIVSLLNIFLFILLALIFLFLMFLVGKRFYFKGALGLSATAAKSRMDKNKAIKYLSGSSNALLSYIVKDLKILFRTPIFFLNNVLMNFLFPLFMLVPVLLGTGSEEGFSMLQIREMAGKIEFGDRYVIWILLVFFGLLVFTFGTNGVTETAISREGSRAYFMKIIPMSYKKQIAAKVLTGVLLSAAGALVSILIMGILFRPPLWLLGLCVLILPGAIGVTNLSGIFFDLYMPKTVWDNEQKAVKQNTNVLLGILASLFFIALIVLPVLAGGFGFYAAFLYILLVPILISLLAVFLLNRITDKCMIQLSA